MREHLRRSSVVSAVAGLLVAILAFVPAILPFLHWERPKWYEVVGGVIALLALWISFVLATFFQQIEIESEIRSSREDARRHDMATTEVIAAALGTEDMKMCRRLFSIVNTISGCKNPLMDALARSQLSGLAEFLEKFDKGLPFFPENELINIDKHYTSFMERMGRRGKYFAATCVQFWHEQDEEILRDFFHNNEVAANDGVKIQRVFLVTKSEEQDPRTLIVLRHHYSITGRGYRNAGYIETKVFVVDVFNRDHDDFGIYVLDDQLMAIAIAKFDGKTGRLRGNEVSFNEGYMRKKLQLFEDRWRKGMEVKDYLDAALVRAKALEGHPTSASAGQ
jgi:hypothetical protein